jgi:HPt (histidine-containing phosphotransfer) domain-containing protein
VNLGRVLGLARAATADRTFRARTSFTLAACTIVGLLATADHNRTLDELEQQFLAEQRSLARAKADEVRRFMDTFYENLRALSLIPAVRGIEHRGNRRSADTSAVELGWFAADASETVQQFYNTLALTVPVSEVYLTLRGYSPHRGEVPFLMYDELVLGGAAVDGAPEPHDFPEEAEEEEYDVIEHQIDAFARWYPRFEFPSLHAVPAAMSTSLRTCDNTQYYSRSKHDVLDAFGHVYSVPVYAPGQGPLIGVLSAVFRTNQLEALLVGVPQLVVTDADHEAARAQAWTTPPPSSFALIQAERELVINDRRQPVIRESALRAPRGEQRRHSRVQALWPRGIGDDGWELYYEYDTSAYDHRVLDERAYLAQRVVALTLIGVMLIAFFARESQTRGALGAAVTEAQASKSQADTQNQQLRLVLNAVEEGLVVADAEGRVTSECSAAFTRWFGETAAGEDLARRLGSLEPDFGASFGAAWAQCSEGALPIELALDQLPRRCDAGGRRLEFDYRALGAGRSFRGALVRVSDVTRREQELVERQRQQELVSLSTRLVRDRDGVLGFLDEAEAMVECLRDGDAAARARALHSLKGASAVMGLAGLARECHEAESEAAAAGVDVGPDHVARVEMAWAELRAAVRAIEPDGPRPLRVPAAQLDALVHELRQRGLCGLADSAEAWHLEPIETELSRQAEHVHAVCRSLGKQAEVEIRVPDIRLDPSVWRSFWGSLIHVVRNCVDHGLYSPDASPEGHVNRVILSAERRDGALVVEVADNGRGIDWAAVRRSLARRGLPCETDAELWHGLFIDGVSSRTSVSATSGRGVGMAAVRHEVERRGGHVSLVTGAGTTWRFEFPSVATLAPPGAGLVPARTPDAAA